jgi:NADPH-dependent 2,4-dienoyl-CoA reductase/sulfur reductase-like enzyme
VDAIGENFIVLGDGSRESFDRLILATGGKASVPQMPIAPGALVFTLREYLDLVKLNAFLPECRQVVIIGGGVLALEIADSLLTRNIQVTVLERSDQLFPGKMAPDAAAELLARLNDHENLRIRCAVSAAGIGRAGVLTESGEVFPADAVICAAGSAPRTILAADAGIKVKGQSLPVTVIQDGFLSREDLARAGKDMYWLTRELSKRKSRQDRTLLLTVDGEDNIVWIGKEDSRAGN